jgi:hypothetical protein
MARTGFRPTFPDWHVIIRFSCRFGSASLLLRTSLTDSAPRAETEPHSPRQPVYGLSGNAANARTAASVAHARSTICCWMLWKVGRLSLPHQFQPAAHTQQTRDRDDGHPSGAVKANVADLILHHLRA